MYLTLLDWRRRVGALYSDIRRTEDIRAAHERWRTTRDTLFRRHPDSPLPPEARERFTGLPVAPYDPGMRFEVELDTGVGPARMEVARGTDGIDPFARIGRVRLAGLGDLDV